MPSESLTPRAVSTSSREQGNDVYDDGYLHVEHTKFYATCAGRPLFNLTRKEFLILSRLVRDAERPVAKQELWTFAWGKKVDFNNNTFRVHIANLRRKLSPFGLDIIAFVHVGYRLARTGGSQTQEISL